MGGMKTIFKLPGASVAEIVRVVNKTRSHPHRGAVDSALVREVAEGRGNESYPVHALILKHLRKFASRRLNSKRPGDSGTKASGARCNEGRSQRRARGVSETLTIAKVPGATPGARLQRKIKPKN